MIRILGGGPQNLKNWNGSCGGRPPRYKRLKFQNKRGENTIKKITKNFLLLLKQRIIVRATLWWTICPFTKCDLLLIAFFCYNIMGKFHGCVNTMGEWVPWVDDTHNTMGKFHGWINNMEGWMPWVDATYNTMDKYHGWMPISISWINTMDRFHFPFESFIPP